MNYWATVVIVTSVVIMGGCIWAIGAICGIAYTIEKERKFKRPPMLEVVRAEDSEP